MLLGEQRRDLIEGRQIAGHIMLQGIFDLLREWTAINLTNFWTQLCQFFDIYSVPYVFEEKQKKWDSLDFGKDDVSIVYGFKVVSSAMTRDIVLMHGGKKTFLFFVLPGENDAQGIDAA